jgi:hypothetical protein
MICFFRHIFSEYLIIKNTIIMRESHLNNEFMNYLFTQNFFFFFLLTNNK